MLPVAPEEGAHYKEKGWVQLKRFIEPEMIATLLAKAKGLMGEDGDTNPSCGIGQPDFNAFDPAAHNMEPCGRFPDDAFPVIG